MLHNHNRRLQKMCATPLCPSERRKGMKQETQNSGTGFCTGQGIARCRVQGVTGPHDWQLAAGATG
jgi:hypothetical protein